MATEVANCVLQTIVDDMDVEGTISSDSTIAAPSIFKLTLTNRAVLSAIMGKVLKALQLLAQNYLYNRYSRTFYITINVNDTLNTVQSLAQSSPKKLATHVFRRT